MNCSCFLLKYKNVKVKVNLYSSLKPLEGRRQAFADRNNIHLDEKQLCREGQSGKNSEYALLLRFSAFPYLLPLWVGSRGGVVGKPIKWIKFIYLREEAGHGVDHLRRTGWKSKTH